MIQLSGWIGARDLWTGAVLDTDFLKQTNILDRQNDFLQHDFVNGELVPFTNIHLQAKLLGLRLLMRKFFTYV